MFYQEALPKFWFASRVDSLLAIRDRHWRKLAAMFEKAESDYCYKIHPPLLLVVQRIAPANPS